MSHLTGAVLLVLVSSALGAASPWLLKRIVDAMTRGQAVVEPVLVYAGVQFAARAAGELRLLPYARAEQIIQHRFGPACFERVLRLAFACHHDVGAGPMAQTLANAIAAARLALQHVVLTVLPGLATLGAMAASLHYLGQGAFLFILLGTFMAYGLSFAIGARALKAPADAVAAVEVEKAALLMDGLQNIEAVKCFRAEAVIAGRLRRALGQSAVAWRCFYDRKAGLGLVSAGVFAGGLGLMTMLAAARVASGALSVGDFVLINAYILQSMRPVELLGSAPRDLAQATADIRRLALLLRQPREDAAPAAEAEILGDLAFEDVTFFYRPGRQVLRNVSFKVPPGGMLAIVGASGSGKSTIVRLATGLYPPATGRILLDGVPIDGLPLARLRKAIAIVPQDTILLRGTMAENVALGREGSTPAMIESAARLAGLGEYLSASQDNNAGVGERGLALSGGERQRVAIARAILAATPILILDEATAALDVSSERALIETLSMLPRRCTRIVIAHRLASVVEADEILVFDRGMIAERGTHRTLLACEGLYATLWRLQQSALEAGH